jgi:glutathione S-transferase
VSRSGAHRAEAPEPVWELHGLKLSYFTGKLEAWLRARGLPFRFVEMDTAGFRACARATGVAQMPALRTPDGVWLTDTTRILRRLETEAPGPALQPTAPAAAFLSLFLEDAFDEWLWRPALYYRWAFPHDARLMSRAIARTLLRDLPLPFPIRAQAIRWRQRRVYLRGDGVTLVTAPAVAQVYLDVLASLEPILSRRPFLFGERPVAADFGLFGPMFRHFASDPTPAALMRERAPSVLAWTARLWNLDPGRIAAHPLPETAPDDLDPLLRLAAGDHLAELSANAEAAAAGRREARFRRRGVDWRLPVSPYRVHCLSELQAAFSALDPDVRTQVLERLGPESHLLAEPRGPGSPAAPEPGGRILNRLWS